MSSTSKILTVIGAVMFIFVSCRRDVDVPVVPAVVPGNSPVVFDLALVPYTNLSEYNFFQGPIQDLAPVQGVLTYDVNTPLFSDYASKKRFVWMPQGVRAEYVADDQALSFGDGSVLIKNFYYENVLPGNTKRIIETRIMFKRNGLWEFANYVWNDAQTDAMLDMGGSYTPIAWTTPDGIERSTLYRIPSSAECLTCHKQDLLPIPIGPKPQNLNKVHVYSDGTMGQLDKWVEMGYLNGGFPSAIETTVKWDDPSEDLQDRVRAYLDMNCSHCHADQKHCDYRPIRFAWSESADPQNLGICVPPDEGFNPILTHIVSSGNEQRSMMHYRMSVTDESLRMPLLGRTVVHDEGLQLVKDWINSLQPACD